MRTDVEGVPLPPGCPGAAFMLVVEAGCGADLAQVPTGCTVSPDA